MCVSRGQGLKGLIDPSTAGSGFDLNQISNSYAGWKYDGGPSLVDRTLIAFVNFVYDLPILKNRSNVWATRLIGGWQVSGVVSFASGNPINITVGGITNCAAIPTPSSCTGSLIGTANISSVLPNSNNGPNVNGCVGTEDTSYLVMRLWDRYLPLWRGFKEQPQGPPDPEADRKLIERNQYVGGWRAGYSIT
jgi:hypothetical protein